MKTNCVWCGKEMESEEGVALMDTCEDCDDFLEDNIDSVIDTFNMILTENENKKPKTDEARADAAWVSYSIISAISFFQGRPAILFRDSKFVEYLQERE